MNDRILAMFENASFAMLHQPWKETKLPIWCHAWNVCHNCWNRENT